jgi:hypothetical protein
MAYNLETRSQRPMKHPYLRPGRPYGGPYGRPLPGSGGVWAMPMPMPTGTRGIEGEQGQQPGVGFQGGFQGQVGPQQGLGMAQPSDITPQEKTVLRGVLDILKETRVALTRGVSDEMDDVMEQRQTAAHAYLCGFMEAKGQQELGEYISTIPPVSTRGVVDEGEYDEMIDTLEQLAAPETRILPVLGGIAVSAAGSALWDVSKGPLKAGARKLGRKIRRMF